MEVLKNNGTFFYELNRKTKYETIARETSMPSIANTYKNEPQFQDVQNKSRNYMRTGNQKFADPFAFHSRPYYDDFNGRRTQILETLQYNAKKDKPDVITKHPFKVVGFY